MIARCHLPVLILGAALLTWSGTAEAEDGVLPAGAGRDDVEALCGSCHSLRLVTQQGLARDVWSEVIDYMVEEQDMPELEPDEEILILDYLARFYGPDRLGARTAGE